MLFILCFSVALTAQDKPVKIAIIGDTEKHLADMDQLTVKLSADENIHVLERSDWDYLLRERQISQSKIGQSSVEIGRLLGADGLIILTEEEIKGKKYLLSKLVAVKSGLILDSIVSPVDEKKEAFSLADSIEFRFKPKLAKLADNQNKITISMLNLRSAIASPELITIEKELNTIFTQRLMREQNVLVSERWNIAEAAFEKNLDGKNLSGFKTGSVILDGTIELKGKDTVEVNLLITTPDGKKQEFKVSGKKDNLAEIAEDLNSKCLAVAKVAKKIIEWDREKEADEYYKEAKWAFNAGLFFKAAQSAESAWALGCRENDLIEVRIKCYANAAYPAFIKLKKNWGNYNPYLNYKNLIDVSKTDKYLDAAIMALEIFRHYFLVEKRGSRKDNYPRLSRQLGNELVDRVSLLLYAYYDQKQLFKDQEKQAFVRKLLIECNDKIGKSERFLGIQQQSLWSFFEHAKLWFEPPEEIMAMYEKILSQTAQCLKCRSYDELNIRHYVNQYNPPFFIDRSGTYDKSKEHKLLQTLCKRLINSKNKQLQLDGLVINYLFGTPTSSYFEKKGGEEYDEEKYFKRNENHFLKIYEFYQQHKELFWDNTLKIDPRILEDLIKKHDNISYEYLEGALKHRNIHQINQHSRDLTSSIDYSKLSNEEKKKLYSILDNRLSTLTPKQQWRQGFYVKYLQSYLMVDTLIALFPDKIYKHPNKLGNFYFQKSIINNGKLYELHAANLYLDKVEQLRIETIL